jgi:hypothetical protein
MKNTSIMNDLFVDACEPLALNEVWFCIIYTHIINRMSVSPNTDPKSFSLNELRPRKCHSPLTPLFSPVEVLPTRVGMVRRGACRPD